VQKEALYHARLARMRCEEGVTASWLDQAAAESRWKKMFEPRETK